MKTTIATIAATFATTATTATTAFAATGVPVEHSGFMVWAFLGLCATIFVAQITPAAMLVIGMIKGLANTRRVAKATVPH